MTKFIARTNNISHNIFKMFSGYFLNNGKHDQSLCNAFNVPIQLDFDKNFHKTPHIAFDQNFSPFAVKPNAGSISQFQYIMIFNRYDCLKQPCKVISIETNAAIIPPLLLRHM